MQQFALVTGASSGIGQELAKLCARDGYNLILVARDQQRLETLGAKLRRAYGVEALVLARDLGGPEAGQAVYAAVKARELNVEILINSAGFGGYGEFMAADWEKEAAMIALNITALTQLCKLFGRDMQARGSGQILNLASVAAFLPGPLMAVYYATKHYVLAFSESLAEELTGSGVSVTALCPGPSRSQFAKTARAHKTRAFARPLPSAVAVAAHGYRAMMAGQVVAIYPFSSRLAAFLTRLAPRWLVRRLIHRAQSK